MEQLVSTRMCYVCRGRGSIIRVNDHTNGSMTSYLVRSKCPICKGKGRIE